MCFKPQKNVAQTHNNIAYWVSMFQLSSRLYVLMDRSEGDNQVKYHPTDARYLDRLISFTWETEEWSRAVTIRYEQQTNIEDPK
jgi:hypothetical protein